VYKRHVIQQT